jgi:hypothetical protein
VNEIEYAVSARVQTCGNAGPGDFGLRWVGDGQPSIASVFGQPSEIWESSRRREPLKGPWLKSVESEDESMHDPGSEQRTIREFAWGSLSDRMSRW